VSDPDDDWDDWVDPHRLPEASLTCGWARADCREPVTWNSPLCRAHRAMLKAESPASHGRCRAPGCNDIAGPYGHCHIHQPEAARGWCKHCDRAPLIQGLCGYHLSIRNGTRTTIDWDEPAPTRRANACTIPDCDDSIISKGLCLRHYTAARRRAKGAPARRRPGGFCRADDCDRPADTQGLCDTHYRKYLATSPGGVTCTVDGCDKRSRARGLCPVHYEAERRTNPTRPTCTIDGCTTPVTALNLCRRHYNQARRAQGKSA